MATMFAVTLFKIRGASVGQRRFLRICQLHSCIVRCMGVAGYVALENSHDAGSHGMALEPKPSFKR